MDAWDTARAHGAGRVGFGVALIAAPGLVGRAWVGRDGGRPAVAVYSAGLGMRDLALGAGVLAASRGRIGARPWVLAGMAADAADLAVTLRHRDALPRAGVAGVALMAATSIAVGAWLRGRLD